MAEASNSLPSIEHAPAGRTDRRVPGVVAPVLAQSLLREAEHLGLDTSPLWEDMALVPSDLAKPCFMVTYHEASALVRSALRLIRRPNLGLDLGMQPNLPYHGALALGIPTSATLRDATRLLEDYPVSGGHLLVVSDRDEERGNVMTASPLLGNEDIQEFLIDFFFASSVRLRRALTGTYYAPLAVELIRSRPSDAEYYDRILGCQVVFGASQNRFISDAGIFDVPLPRADEKSFRLAVGLLGAESVAAADSAPMVFFVRRAITRTFPAVARPSHLAAALEMSERSLRRSLQAAGWTYQALLDECRKTRAIELIVNGRMPLTHVALETGFADLRSFRRAFRRWTGQLPSELKRRPMLAPIEARSLGLPGIPDTSTDMM